MEYDVFISYSRRDYVDENKQKLPNNIISQIRELFDNNDISYWFDEEGVFSGDAFAPVIARNIKNAKTFLFVSSENSNASEWTSNEIATAHAYKKRIIPFRYDDSVYNDSVIIYIARLDYIDYKGNPSKALTRLLTSVQNYLKEDTRQKEREHQEAELRRRDEESRQERNSKLQGLLERISSLENRRYQIDQDILTHDRALIDLRNEKRIIETNLANLHAEEKALVRQIRNGQDGNDYEQPKRQNLLSREWAELKTALSLKNWVVNSVYFIYITALIICIIAANGSLAYAGISLLFALYRLLKNNRDGIVWGITSTILCNFIINNVFFLILSVCATLFLALMLYIKKDKVSAWNLLHPRTKRFKKDMLFIAYIIMLSIAMVLYMSAL